MTPDERATIERQIAKLGKKAIRVLSDLLDLEDDKWASIKLGAANSAIKLARLDQLDAEKASNITELSDEELAAEIALLEDITK